MAVSELVEVYLKEGPADRPRKKASSWVTDASNLRRHVVPLLGRRRASTLIRSDLQRLQADVTAGKTKAPDAPSGRKRGRVRVRGGAGTAWRATVAMAAALAWATERGVVPSNPAKGLRLNKLADRERFLTDEEIARLGEAMTAADWEGPTPRRSPSSGRCC